MICAYLRNVLFSLDSGLMGGSVKTGETISTQSMNGNIDAKTCVHQCHSLAHLEEHGLRTFFRPKQTETSKLWNPILRC